MEGYIVDGLVHAVPEGSGQVSLVLQEPQHCESCQGNWVGLKRSMVPTKKNINNIYFFDCIPSLKCGCYSDIFFK